jgi:hypothetical protein
MRGADHAGGPRDRAPAAASAPGPYAADGRGGFGATWRLFWRSVIRCARKGPISRCACARSRYTRRFRAPIAGAIARISNDVRRLEEVSKAETRTWRPAHRPLLPIPTGSACAAPGDAPRYLLSGGKGAVLPEGDPMGRRAPDRGDRPRRRPARGADQGRARGSPRANCAPSFCDRIAWRDSLHLVPRSKRRVEARRQERLDALVLDDRRWDDAPDEAVAHALCTGIRELGLEALGWTKSAQGSCARASPFPV